jgi:hypothetical protein
LKTTSATSRSTFATLQHQYQFLQHQDLLLQHKYETLATFFRNLRNTPNMHLQHTLEPVAAFRGRHSQLLRPPTSNEVLGHGEHRSSPPHELHRGCRPPALVAPVSGRRERPPVRLASLLQQNANHTWKIILQHAKDTYATSINIDCNMCRQ